MKYPYRKGGVMMKSYMTDKRIEGKLTNGNFVNKAYEVSQMEFAEVDVPLIIDLQGILEDALFIVTKNAYEPGYYMSVDVTITTICYSLMGIVERCDPLGNGMYYVKLYIEELPNGILYELEDYIN